MKTYPSIPYYAEFVGRPCIGFKKYDGSNLRFEWSKKKGWHKFGTRRHLFDRKDPVYGPAVDLFEKTLAEPLVKSFTDQKDLRGTENAIVFAEFFGPNSFAGDHVPEDPKELILFDVNIHKKGLVSPRDFIKFFANMPSAEVLYNGELTEEFIQEVIEGTVPVQEGVVVKGGQGHQLWMAKIKTADWIRRVKEQFPTEWSKIV
jgi:hypothetical protein